MPNIVCPTKTPPGCACFDSDPVANFSSEKPDQDVFIANVFFDGTDSLGLNQIFDQLSCLGICESSISQEAADDCARQIAELCAWQTWRNQPGFTGRRPFRRGTPIPIFFNTFQSCNVACPDGSIFGWTIAAGTIAARSQQEADDLAQELACQRANLHRICITPSALTGCCAGIPYAAQIETHGHFAPFTFGIVSGALPTGLSLDPATGIVSGLAISGAGNFTFGVQVTDGAGGTQTKTLSLVVVAITAPLPLPDAMIGTPYSAQLSMGPFHDVSNDNWQLVFGTLPPGLTLSPSGLISGTPGGTVQPYPFTLQFTGVFGGSTVTCNHNVNLNVASFPCGQGVPGLPANFKLFQNPISLGAFAVLPDGNTTVVSANTPVGPYRVIYNGGAYQSPNNPCPAPSFKIPNEYRLNYNAGSINLSSPGFPCAGTQAGVEALMPLGRTDSFQHTGGQITFTTIANDTGFNCGSPCPTWEVFQDPTLLPEPTLLSIHNYAAIAAQFICPTCCLPDVPVLGGGPTEWNGSFGSNSIYSGVRSYSSTSFSERNDNFVAQNISIDGRILWSVRCLAPKTGAQVEADIQLAANNHIVPGTLPQTQNFWYFSIWSLRSGFIFEIIWAGVKAYGTTPRGTYARVDACDPVGSPTCVTLDGSNDSAT